MRLRGVLLLLGLVVLGLPAGALAQGSCPNEALREETHSLALPDCRAYELVSPPDKNGGDVMAVGSRTRVASDGGAIAFPSLTGFGDVAGMGVAADYLAVRSTVVSPGTNGWATHAITPLQQPLTLLASTVALDPLYEGDFSSDLSRGVFRAWSLLGDAPNVRNVENLYLRTDLRSAGAGSYQLLSDAIAPVGSTTSAFGNFGKPALAGTSADFEHVLFESRYSLTADATGSGPWLYEWDHGTLRVAGVLPDGTTLSGAVAGQGTSHHNYTPHTISADGLKVFFTDRSTGVSTIDGTLYMRRTDPVTGVRGTVQLNASERTDCADHDPCSGTPEPDPDGQQPATYWDASVNGDRVFFTTTEALTDDAPAGTATKLYMYDTSRPDSDPHNLTFLSVDRQPADTDSVEGVLGASGDGSYVYFLAAGQLVFGAPLLDTDRGIYLWHDGIIAYVGELSVQEDWSYDLPTGWTDRIMTSRVTPDGRHLLFMSSSGEGLTGANQGVCPLNPSGNGQCQELYVYSADTGQLRCASCGQDSASATADAVVSPVGIPGGAVPSWSRNRVLSDDGRYVFFSTANALVPRDTNGVSDAYEYDTVTGQLHLLSSGTDPGDSYFVNASPSGSDAFIATRQRFVGWDVDGAYDLYDVRGGGGVPEPTASSSECVGDACQGALPGPSVVGSPASAGLLGAGNVSPPVIGKPVVRKVSGAQRLSRALKACKRKPRGTRRKRCESQARARFGRNAAARRASTSRGGK